MRAIKNPPWHEIVVTVLVIATGVAVYAWSHRDQGSLEASKNTGTVIVDALSAYYADHGSYPDRLDDLVPRYIADIEQPIWGLREWRYRSYSAADVAAESASAAAAGSVSDENARREYFQLSVAADPSGYPLLFYDLAVRQWVLNN